MSAVHFRSKDLFCIFSFLLELSNSGQKGGLRNFFYNKSLDLTNTYIQSKYHEGAEYMSRFYT